MNNDIHQYRNVREVNESLAEWLVKDIQQVLLQQDKYTIALSGGSTPKSFYELLAKGYSDKIDWLKVHVFFDDERYVPFTDERNNAAMVHRAVLQHVNIPANQVHNMQTDTSPEESAHSYEAILHQYFDGRQHTFDLVLLGMGDDGHTLSLFPGTSVVNEQTRWVSEVLLDNAGNYRITLTAPVVNRADKIIFLVTGQAKAQTLQKVLQGPPNKFPSQLIQPASNNLMWFIDDAAAMISCISNTFVTSNNITFTTCTSCIIISRTFYW